MRAIATLAVLALVAAPAWCQMRSILDVGSARTQRAIVTLDESAPTLEESGSPMALQLQGVLADLKGKGLLELRKSVPPNPRIGDASDAERLCVIHLEAPGASKRLAVFRKGGSLVAVELDAPGGKPPARAELRRDEFAALYASWPRYRGGFDASTQAVRARTFEARPPHEPSHFTLDTETVSKRMRGGSTPSSEPTVRDLATEKFSIRLPRGYEPSSPAGLLVWVNAGPMGDPPGVYGAVFDELNLIAIGAADSGNQRNVYARVQLALDAVATASRDYHVDPRRVYVSGISGGGRIASIAQVCFPEVFTGCVPIVGMSCYRNVPNGLGQYYRAAFDKPPASVFALARQRRMAPMTGRRDGNQIEMQNATDILQRDGIPMKLFDDPQMGHELAKPEAFKEALQWVDEPYRRLRQKEGEAAAAAMEAYRQRCGDKRPETAQERALLVKAMQAGPWTEPAWRAWGLLKPN